MTKKFWMIMLTVAIAFVLAACSTEKAEAPEQFSPESQTITESAPPAPESMETNAAQAKYDASPVVITVNNLAAAGLSEDGSASVTDLEDNGTHPAVQENLPVEGLPRVTDGQTITTMADVRQGPGIDYGQLGTLQLGQLVDVVAINPQQDWVLIKSSGLIGWVLAENMSLFDLPDVLPTVMTSAPDANMPVGEIAPIFAVSGEGEPDA